MILFEYINRVVAWHQSRDRGASAVEYGLLLAAIIGALAFTFFFLGDEMAAMLDDACDAATEVDCP